MVAAGKVRVGNGAGRLIGCEYREEIWIDMEEGEKRGFREQRS